MTTATLTLASSIPGKTAQHGLQLLSHLSFEIQCGTVAVQVEHVLFMAQSDAICSVDKTHANSKAGTMGFVLRPVATCLFIVIIYFLSKEQVT